MSIYMEKKRNLWVIPTDKPSRLYEFGGSYSLQPKAQENFRNYHIYITNSEEIKEGDWMLNLSGLKYNEQVISRASKNAETNWANNMLINDGKKSIRECIKKIILTTDQDLDGVQPIGDEFLEWFVKNPSCKEVEVEKGYLGMCGFVKSSEPISKDKLHYKIIKPQEEPKQYPIGGYAPGYYGCTCVTCKTEFMGDKRAVQCEPCAIKTVDEAKQRAANYMRLKGALDTQYVDFSNPNADKISSASTASFKQERMYSEEEVETILKSHKEFIVKELKGLSSFRDKNHWFEQFKKK
jgi:hypothetical protein